MKSNLLLRGLFKNIKAFAYHINAIVIGFMKPLVIIVDHVWFAPGGAKELNKAESKNDFLFSHVKLLAGLKIICLIIVIILIVSCLILVSTLIMVHDL